MSKVASVKTIYDSFVSLSESWPSDALRPDHQFGPSIQSAARRAFTKNDHPSTTSKGKEAQITQDDSKLVFKELNETQLDYARQALKSLENLRDNKAGQEFPTPTSIIEPASNSAYYYRLLATLDGASRGNKTVMSWSERARIFFGGKP